MRTPTLREVDLLSGALLVVLGIFVTIQGLGLGFYQGDVPGPGFFPTVLAILLTVAGATLITTRLRTNPRTAAGDATPAGTPTTDALTQHATATDAPAADAPTAEAAENPVAVTTAEAAEGSAPAPSTAERSMGEPSAGEAEPGEGSGVAVARPYVRPLALWGAIFVASLLVGLVGFPIAMLGLTAVVLFVIERRRGIGAIVTTLAIPLLAWLLFAELLQVPLPVGPFGT